MTIAGVGGIIAVIFAIQHDFNKAFVAAAIGAVAWFLNYRFQVKELIARSDEEDKNYKRNMDFDDQD